LDSQWVLLKGYSKVAGKCQQALDSLWVVLKDVGKLLGNAQITPISQWEREQNCPAPCSKK
jgi:hypothetical protein